MTEVFAEEGIFGEAGFIAQLFGAKPNPSWNPKATWGRSESGELYLWIATGTFKDDQVDADGNPVDPCTIMGDTIFQPDTDKDGNPGIACDPATQQQCNADLYFDYAEFLTSTLTCSYKNTNEGLYVYISEGLTDQQELQLEEGLLRYKLNKSIFSKVPKPKTQDLEFEEKPDGTVDFEIDGVAIKENLQNACEYLKFDGAIESEGLTC